MAPWPSIFASKSSRSLGSFPCTVHSAAYSPALVVILEYGSPSCLKKLRTAYNGASPIVPSRFGQRYAAGRVVERGRQLFVTTGVGTSTIPVRLGVPPEVAVLDVNR